MPITKRPRGRINPPNLAERHRIDAARHVHVHRGFAAANPPATYDCTNLCTPIKDQESCGSCWDFSGTCVVEAANIKAGVLPDNTAASQLSEQYTLDQCDGSNGGCNGDDNTTVLSDAKSGGLPLTSAYGSYEGRAEACKWPPPHARRRVSVVNRLYTLSDWGYVGAQSGVPSVQAIKAAMMQYGPIGCAVAADDAFENYQPGSVFQGSGSTEIDHDVVLVGWDDGKAAWKLRNSWGTDWGNAGYMWIAYTANRVGYEAVWGAASGAPVPPSPAAPAIASFTATPSDITAGQSSQLAWTVSGATQLTLNGADVSSLPGDNVAPAATTTFTLTAVNAAGTTQASLTVDVAAPPAPPAPTHRAAGLALAHGVDPKAALAAIHAISGLNLEAADYHEIIDVIENRLVGK